jgi:hypothetical protein
LSLVAVAAATVVIIIVLAAAARAAFKPSQAALLPFRLIQLPWVAVAAQALMALILLLLQRHLRAVAVAVEVHPVQDLRAAQVVALARKIPLTLVALAHRDKEIMAALLDQAIIRAVAVAAARGLWAVQAQAQMAARAA